MTKVPSFLLTIALGLAFGSLPANAVERWRDDAHCSELDTRAGGIARTVTIQSNVANRSFRAIVYTSSAVPNRPASRPTVYAIEDRSITMSSAHYRGPEFRLRMRLQSVTPQQTFRSTLKIGKEPERDMACSFVMRRERKSNRR